MTESAGVVASVTAADHVFLGQLLALSVVAGEDCLPDFGQIGCTEGVIRVGIEPSVPEGFLAQADFRHVHAAVDHHSQTSVAEGERFHPFFGGFCIVQLHINLRHAQSAQI